MILLIFQVFISVSCSGNEVLNSADVPGNAADQYTVYIVNNNLHTGIIIPVNGESLKRISGMKFFMNFMYADIGWGEERFYQDPDDNFCMAARAVFFPNSSVIRMEGYDSVGPYFVSWSDYTVELIFTREQFIKLSDFIGNSFKKDTTEDFIVASKRHSGSVIFFKSVYRYCLFNTCNTWVADALKNSGFEVSGFPVITARQLYYGIRDKGIVLKPLK